MAKVDRIRSLAHAAATLHQHGDKVRSAAPHCRNRSLARTAHDTWVAVQTAGTYLSDKLNNDLSKLAIEEAVPLTRALGHYLMLVQQAEIHHRQALGGRLVASATNHVRLTRNAACSVRSTRARSAQTDSCDSLFASMLAKGISVEALHEAVCRQV